MDSALALLIFLPLIEIFSSNLAKNHHKIYLFFILFLASFSLVLSYNLNISSLHRRLSKSTMAPVSVKRLSL